MARSGLDSLGEVISAATLARRRRAGRLPHAFKSGFHSGQAALLLALQVDDRPGPPLDVSLGLARIDRPADDTA
ncbi:UNVERIFIED_CONTAM: hypothetical protein NY603_33365, partial [Bacteroidetes bacterium 56_B9]